MYRSLSIHLLKDILVASNFVIMTKTAKYVHVEVCVWTYFFNITG